ncbi:HD domain-containing protein [Paenibacillus sp. MBLB4367]|uniref:HD domain-containing protein n=1 Tax=Paenibacillus sp. MBLB4367 TaxID=3384767 RepID=UPI003907FE29
MTNERLLSQLSFIVEIDKLKTILRKSLIMDGSRLENDAEHTWHLAMMALILNEHANDKSLDILRVLKMLLIHDIVEIDAGDTFAYDVKGNEDKAERENAAAERIFGLLPADQKAECLLLWQEFEVRQTSEAKYAAALDRLQPLLHNYHTQGYSWKKHGITSDMVLARNKHIASGSEELWAFAQELIQSAVAKGYLEA